MKQHYIKRLFCGLLAVAMISPIGLSIGDRFIHSVDVKSDLIGVRSEMKEDIHWSFETGALSPFKIADGSFGSGIIANWITERNSSAKINKDGSYYLSTVEVDTSEKTDFGYTGTIVSPVFAMQDPSVTLKVGGGAVADNYVAIVRRTDDTVLAKYTNTNSSKSPYALADVTLTVPSELYSEGMEVYLKIVDGSRSNDGFIQVDDIRASGKEKKNHTYGTVVWDFEKGSISPFVPEEGVTFNKEMVSRMTYDYNMRLGDSAEGRILNKNGEYFLTTGLDKGKTHTVSNGKCTQESAGTYNLNVMGSLMSPPFVLDPDNIKITMQIGGNPLNSVAVYDFETGERVGEARSAKSSWIMSAGEVVWNKGFEYKAGQELYMQIEDVTNSNSSGGWQFISVDNIRFSGQIVGYEYDYEYADTIWSFENGTYQPFYTEDSFGGGLIATFTNNQSVPHGKYYLNTVLTVPNANKYNESFVGTLTSPEFLLNPNEPIITLSVNGGKAQAGNYVAVCNAETGVELAKVGAENSWNFVSRTIDLSGKFAEGDKLVLKIVDGTTKSWAWIGVDNIRGSFAFPEKREEILSNLAQVMKTTGWDQEDFDRLILMVTDHMKRYSVDEYPNGKNYLSMIQMMQSKQEALAGNNVNKDSKEVADWIREMESLANDICMTNPILDGQFIIFTVHHQYRKDHHNTHNMFPAYNGEISDKALYTPGGAVKVLDLQSGKVYTLLEDPDGLYRDLDVSYDSNKILLSYRENANSVYNVVEYTLSADRRSITATKQLTSLPTADDMDPMYLPSGDIVFSSTRDPKYVMCNRHIAANLYRMESDGANIVKITSSTLFERPTDVLPDGRILYDRWEYNDRDFGSAQGIWTVYEDGTKQDTYYGNNSPTGAAIEGKVIPGTQKIMVTLSSTHDVSWGALAIIDRSKGVDGKTPVDMTWPANVRETIGDPNVNSNNIDAYLNLSVKYEDPQPLSENYFLASRTLPGTTKMGLYLLDTYGNETLLYEDSSAMSVFDATLLTVREREIDTADRRDYKDNVGTFFVQDVYLGTHMEGVERGSVATLRIVESVDKKYIAQSQQWQGEGQQNPGTNWHSFEVKRVIGEVPVYEDGSAYFEVPQDVFVYFQLLDKDGRMIQSMRSGTLVQSGEKTGCVGCHEDRRTAPPTNNGRNTPMALEANVKIVENPDYVEGSNMPKTIAINTPDVPQKRVLDYETGKDILVDWDDPRYFDEYTDLPVMNFLTEVQPLFTNNCLSCHGYDDPKAGLSLVPDKDVIFNAAYINLWVDRNKSGVFFENLVGAVGAGNSSFYNAKSWGSYNSPLVQKLFDDASHMELLTEAERRKITEWVDLNGTYYGDYCSNYSYNPGGRSPLTDAERSSIGDTRTMGWNSFTLASLNKGIYFDNPEKSPILKGKTGQEYSNMLSIIEKGLERLRINPDVDWAGLETVPGNSNLSINPYKQNEMDAWRTEKVALYDAMEAANRAAIVAGTKLYDSDHEKAFIKHNAKWPGWPTVTNPKTPYTTLPQ